MSYIQTAVVTALFTVLFLVLYKYVVNPQVVIVPGVSQCPERWNYNAGTQMCEPAYKTACLPFNPDVTTLKSAAARCNLAKTCGTSWSGSCP